MACVLAAVGGLAAAGSGLEDPETRSRAPQPPKGTAEVDGDTLTMAFARRPRSLDPAFATDRTSANLVLNLMDPLVRLGPSLNPVPGLARRWTISTDGLRIRFFLRPEARWRNGDQVTADDVEFAWKRVLSPDLDSPLAEELFAIKGAAAYHRCRIGCSALADAVGVDAVGRYSFVVRLAVPQPWFVASLVRPAFLPVPRAAVIRYGDEWTKPGQIVTDGPFALAGLTESGVSLVKSPRWRAAATVDVARVEGLFISDDVARVQAFDEGRVLRARRRAAPRDRSPRARGAARVRGLPLARGLAGRLQSRGDHRLPSAARDGRRGRPAAAGRERDPGRRDARHPVRPRRARAGRPHGPSVAVASGGGRPGRGQGRAGRGRNREGRDHARLRGRPGQPRRRARAPRRLARAGDHDDRTVEPTGGLHGLQRAARPRLGGRVPARRAPHRARRRAGARRLDVRLAAQQDQLLQRRATTG